MAWKQGMPNWVRGKLEVVDSTTLLKRLAVVSDVDHITYSVDGAAEVTLGGVVSTYVKNPALSDEASRQFNFVVQLPATVFPNEAAEMEIEFIIYGSATAVIARNCIADAIVRCEGDS